jgi:uncharacterized protein (TIGR02391 family)
MTLRDLIKAPADLLDLRPEELARFVLLHLIESGERFIARNNFASESLLRECPQNQEACAKALMEAWSFLETAGLIAPQPRSPYPNIFITRRGKEVAETGEYTEFLKTRLFPRESLHSVIAEKTYGLFLRGEYETAVFQAMKELEVAVREAAGFDTKTIGVDLMRKAFNPTSGPLRDPIEPEAEREALMHLFAGAIGRFKNPSSHRHVSLSDPAETVEILHMASNLLRVVDDRKKSAAKSSAT